MQGYSKGGVNELVLLVLLVCFYNAAWITIKEAEARNKKALKLHYYTDCGEKQRYRLRSEYPLVLWWVLAEFITENKAMYLCVLR